MITLIPGTFSIIKAPTVLPVVVRGGYDYYLKIVTGTQFNVYYLELTSKVAQHLADANEIAIEEVNQLETGEFL